MSGARHFPRSTIPGRFPGAEALLLTAALCGAHELATPPARAADPAPYPNRQITMVVPFGAGTQIDTAARLVAGKLADALAQPVVVENVPGASGNLGGRQVARSKPDGYTLLFTGSLITLLPLTMGSAAVDPLVSYAPVAKLAEPPAVILVSAKPGVSTLSDLLERARRTPGGIAYATAGVGSIHHLAMSLVALKADAPMLHVPYGNSAQARQDLLSGEVPVYVTSLGPLNPYLESGQVRALAVMRERRVSAFPDVPTIVELGFPQAAMAPWNGVLAPAGTPPAVIARLNAEFARIVMLPDVRERFTQMGMEPLSPSPEAFAAEIREAVARWPRVIRESGVVLAK